MNPPIRLAQLASHFLLAAALLLTAANSAAQCPVLPVKLLASNGASIDQSGLSVKISGTTASVTQDLFLSQRFAEFDQIERLPSADPAAFTFEGVVHLPNGTPAEGAVVVSSAGGQTVTGADGNFRLEARVPVDAENVQITVVGPSHSKLLASARVSLFATSGVVAVAPLHLAHSSTCIPNWLPTFGGAQGLDNRVFAFGSFDDGSGPALYAGGYLRYAGGVPANGIAKWDGSSWSALGAGVDGGVLAITVFNDGSGDALYAAGTFTTAGGLPANRIAKWDGSNWSPLAGGMGSTVQALAVYDDGSGMALYAGSYDTGGQNLRVVAKWDGSSWTSLGSGLDGSVYGMLAFDDGTGSALYVGGSFTTAGNAPVVGLAKWDGSNWSAIGGGLNGGVCAFTVHDNGGGDALFVGGGFTMAGGVAANYIAKWDGSSWASLGSGMDKAVCTLTVFNDGTGAQLVAGGTFSTAGGVAANYVAMWDGSTWAPLGNGGVYGPGNFTSVEALMCFDDGGGAALWMGGGFTHVDGLPANYIAKWGGSAWTLAGEGLNREVLALTVFDDGNGTALYAGGQFTTAGGVEANRIAKWDGSSWEPLGTGMDGPVLAIVAFDDGSGPAIFAGGRFWTAGGVPANYIAKWDGSTWTPLGSGIGGYLSTRVQALTVFDDGGGPDLYAAGRFTIAGGLAVRSIAQWNGSSWAPLNGGPAAHPAYAMTVFDDGNGAALYVGGEGHISSVGPISSLTKWDGSSWTDLGSGVNGSVRTMAVFDDGGGPALFAGGHFGTAGTLHVGGIAKWNGSSWSALAPGSLGGFPAAMAVFDDGSGAALYVGGRINNFPQLSARYLAKWDGSIWSGLGSGINLEVAALTVFDDGGGAGLIAGGFFQTAGISGDSFVAKWGCASTLFGDYCEGDGGDQLGCTDCPCGNNAPQGTIGGCINSRGTSTRINASGDPSVSLPSGTGTTTDLRVDLEGAPGGSFCILLSGSAVAPQNNANMCFGLRSGAQAMDRDGLICAVMNIKHHGGRSANAMGVINGAAGPSRIWGGEAQPHGGIYTQGGFAAGETRYFQVTHREDSTLGCMRGLNTSQAIEVVFTP